MIRQLKTRFRVLTCCCAFVAGNLAASGGEVRFEQDVEPILKQHCMGCHGSDEQESRFRLDRLASMLSGGNSGEPAIVPGDLKSSYLV